MYPLSPPTDKVTYLFPYLTRFPITWFYKREKKLLYGEKGKQEYHLLLLQID